MDKEDLLRYVLNANIAIPMLYNIIHITETIDYLVPKIIPELESSIGPYGATGVEYGLHTAGILMGLGFGLLAVGSTNKLLKDFFDKEN